MLGLPSLLLPVLWTTGKKWSGTNPQCFTWWPLPVAICMRNYRDLTALPPLQNWHNNKRTMWQRYGRWHRLNSFLHWRGIKLSLLSKQEGWGHGPLPMSPGLCCLPTAQWAIILITASLDSTGRSTNRPARNCSIPGPNSRFHFLKHFKW